MKNKGSHDDHVLAIRVCPYKKEVKRSKIFRTPSGLINYADVRDNLHCDLLTVRKCKDGIHDVVTAAALPYKEGFFKKRPTTQPIDIKQYFELTESIPGYLFFWPALVFSSRATDSGNLLDSWGAPLLTEAALSKEVKFLNRKERADLSTIPALCAKNA